jgi:hypothetical protein
MGLILEKVSQLVSMPKIQMCLHLLLETLHN